jgi:hypothetical protein
MKFDDLIDKDGVVIYSPVFTPNKFEIVKIVGIEENGLWIKSKYLDDLGEPGIMQVKEGETPVEAVYFLPFHKIGLVRGMREVSDGPRVHVL